GIALTKLDVLDDFDTIRICTGYELGGKILEELPANLEKFARCKPVYEEMPGWNTTISSCRTFDELPENARRYVRRLEELVGCPIVLVSVGPRRDETIMLKNPFV
ncbi:MAG TPA: adenylosuccinate synthetase, partial [Geobacteraceae bacterium]